MRVIISTPRFTICGVESRLTSCFFATRAAGVNVSLNWDVCNWGYSLDVDHLNAKEDKRCSSFLSYIRKTFPSRFPKEKIPQCALSTSSRIAICGVGSGNLLLLASVDASSKGLQWVAVAWNGRLPGRHRQRLNGSQSRCVLALDMVLSPE